MQDFYNNPDNSNLKTWLEANGIDPSKFYEKFLKGDDFYIENIDETWRFIDYKEIDNIQCAELASDDYILGCFNADFLAEITRIPHAAIEKMQNADCYEALGIILRTGNYIPKLQQAYVKADGYGHHFAHYDLAAHELVIYYDGARYDYYAFRVN